MGRVFEATEGGDRLTILRAQRDSLAREIDAYTGDGTTAPLHNQLRAVLVEIEALEAAAKAAAEAASPRTAVDQLASRREARGASVSGRTGGKGASRSGRAATQGGRQRRS